MKLKSTGKASTDDHNIPNECLFFIQHLLANLNSHTTHIHTRKMMARLSLNKYFTDWKFVEELIIVRNLFI